MSHMHFCHYVHAVSDVLRRQYYAQGAGLSDNAQQQKWGAQPFVYRAGGVSSSAGGLRPLSPGASVCAYVHVSCVCVHAAHV